MPHPIPHGSSYSLPLPFWRYADSSPIEKQRQCTARSMPAALVGDQPSHEPVPSEFAGNPPAIQLQSPPATSPMLAQSPSIDRTVPCDCGKIAVVVSWRLCPCSL